MSLERLRFRIVYDTRKVQAVIEWAARGITFLAAWPIVRADVGLVGRENLTLVVGFLLLEK